ncbi:MAG: YqaA family protein [Novosphingobium sp.]
MLRPLYNWTMAKAAHPHAEWYLAAISFMDGGLFPFPPHPLLGLMCLAEPKKAVRFALITTFASVLGGLLGYTIGHFLYDTVGTQLLGALGLTERFPKAACYLNAYGWQIIVFKAATPIPFLLISLTAGFINFPVWLFLAASLASRAVIFVTIGVLFRIFGAPIKAFIDKYLVWLTLALVALVVGGYVAFAMLSGEGHKTSDKCEAATKIGAPA